MLYFTMLALLRGVQAREQTKQKSLKMSSLFIFHKAVYCDNELHTYNMHFISYLGNIIYCVFHSKLFLKLRETVWNLRAKKVLYFWTQVWIKTSVFVYLKTHIWCEKEPKAPSAPHNGSSQFSFYRLWTTQ